MVKETLEELNKEVQAGWDANAEWWDDFVGPEGNEFQRELIGPATERLLGLRPGELVLDVACGNGAFSRRMAGLGARVVACDFSAKFLERARAHTKEHVDRIEYLLIDATDEEKLLSLGERRFDAAVCTMAMMDMAVIEPLMSALGKLLKPEGRFVFSVSHPCFNNFGVKRVVEEEDRDGEVVVTHSVKVGKYHTVGVVKGLGIIGQPVPQVVVDRTLSTLLNTCFDAGFVLDRLEEPVFGAETEGQRPFSWANFREIPPVMVARLRLA